MLLKPIITITRHALCSSSIVIKICDRCMTVKLLFIFNLKNIYAYSVQVKFRKHHNLVPVNH